MRLFFFLLITAAIFTQQGCAENRQEREKRILAYDPSFQNDLDKRSSLQKKLDEQKAAFLQKKLEIEDQINAFKEKSVILKEEYASSIGNTKRQIQPQKRSLRQDLLEMKRQYVLRKTELSGVTKDIKEIKALIERKDKLSLTQSEMQTWNERLSSLIEKKESIVSDMDRLEKEIEITRLKIKVLEVD
jgi:chromosome segregation ATPase